MILRKTSSWIFSLMVPFLLIIGSVRLLISPLFLELEYRTPYFPADTYGFSLEDRLHWSKIAADYLLNSADITFLGNLKFSDGSQLYNERELSHMEDVKRLVKALFLAFYIFLGAGLLFAFWTWRKKDFSLFFQSLSNGGLLTVILVLMILVGVVVSFDNLFTYFHRIFFKGNTWIFLFSDTLIRLFPMRFWQDAFISMGVLTLAGAAICIVVGRKINIKLSNQA